MLKWVIIAVIVFVVAYLWNNKIIFRIDTLFRKGFKKINDSYGVYCWVGKQGDGKTYSVIDWLSEKTKFSHKKIITNVESYAKLNKDVIYMANFYDIINFITTREKGKDRDYIIFYDELFTMLEKGKLNKDILSFISQLRKRGIYLVTTVQEWLDINVTFRRYCRFYVECSMENHFGCSWSVNIIKSGYDMKWNKDLNEFDSPIIKTTIKKCSKKIADSYDTLEIINTSQEQIIKSPRTKTKADYFGVSIA